MTRRGWLGTFSVALLATRPMVAAAQTDYYNTDRGRPVRIEDAYVTERYAFELKLAPVRISRQRGGAYSLGLEPEIALGVLPRTQIELGLPLAYAEQGTSHRSGLRGVELSAMHNLNVETESIPALGLRADVLTPVGALAPDHVYSSLTALATRTYGWGRVHANAEYTVGSSVPSPTTPEPEGVDVARWLLGAALDRSFPLDSYLLTAELYARQPLDATAPLEYTVGTGTRVQVTPTLAIDAGAGRRLNGAAQGFYVTFGTAYAFGVRSLFPGGR